MLPSPPAFVYFDLDDTLLDHRKAEKKALADLKVKYEDTFAGVTQTEVEDVYHAGNVELWHQYAANEITKTQLRRLRFAHLLDALNIDSLDPTKIGEYYMSRYAQYWDYCAGAREGFAQIADRFPVGILTNGFARVQHAKLAQFPEIRDRVDTCVISEEVGYMKPHPKLFEHAAALANTAPGDILYIGDSMRSDVEGGRAAGWNVIWYAPDEPLHADTMHVRHWTEITGLL